MEKVASQSLADLSPRASALKSKSKDDQSKGQNSGGRQGNYLPAVRFKRRDADEVIQTDAIYTSVIDQPVRIFQCPPEEKNDSAAYDSVPITIMTALSQRAKLSPNQTALASKFNDSWRNISFKEYYERVLTMAKAFIQLGLERCHGVGILGYNCPEWFIANLAAIFAGGVSVAMNTQYTADACQRVAYDSKCNIILASSEVQCSRILQVWNRLPHLKVIVHFNTESADPFIQDVHTWQELVEIGEKCSDEILKDRMLQQAPNICCSLIYKPTPGGGQRGIMLSHDNLLWTASVVGQQLDVRYDRGRIVSFLPLSSVHSQVFEIYVPILFGSTVHFATTPNAIRGSVLETLKEVRPTLFMSVPSLYDRMVEKLSIEFKNEKWLSQKVTLWATNIGRRMYKAQNRGRRMRPICLCLANALVYGRVRRRLGLDQAKLCLATGTPISSKTFLFFVSLNIPILEISGFAETSGFHTLPLYEKYQFRSVGHEMPCCYVDIAKSEQCGQGEVRMKGRNVFLGYLSDPHETTLKFKGSEWYHTGYTGLRDKDGFLFITGRIKDMLITDSGDKVTPRPIEDAVKSKLPCVSHCVLVGEGQKYVSLLLTLKTEPGDSNTSEPSKLLATATIEWLRSLDCIDFTTVQDVRNDMNGKIMSAIQEAIDSVNRKATSKSEYVKKWVILPQDFSVAGGELDPPGKLNRRAVIEKYSQFIDMLYPDQKPTD